MGTTELLVRLGAARRRLDLRLGLTGAAWSALAAAVLVALIKLASLVGVLPTDAGSGWRSGVAVLAIGLLGTAVWVWRSRPDMQAMARRADQRFGLHERLSTALELDGRLPEDERASPVVAALFRDAAAHTSKVDPRSLVPIGLPRPAIAFALVAAGVLALQLIWPTGRAPGSALLAAAADSDSESAAELILDIAELVREEAERESNDELRVVATSLEQLASDVVDEGQGGQPVANELAQLLAEAEAAAANVTESDASAEGFALTLASLAEFLQEEGQGELVARADRETQEFSDSETVAPPSPTSLAAALFERARSALDRVRSRERIREETDAQEQLHNFTAPDSVEMSDGSPPEEEMAQMDGMPATPPSVQTTVSQGRPLANIDLGGGSPIQEDVPLGDTPTPLPGAGTASITGARVDAPDVASSRDFELPTEGGSRRRLPEEIVPQTRFTEVTESALPRGNWQQARQDQATSGYLGVSFREIASRYFLARIRRAEVQAESPAP